jgi:hypothetical protein
MEIMGRQGPNNLTPRSALLSHCFQRKNHILTHQFAQALFDIHRRGAYEKMEELPK